MTRGVDIKYPNSLNLFQFCRRVLDHKFGGIRVIDQDVGQILGFDPADCSHWKKGKKNIRSIQAIKTIADHLGVDEKLVVDVASGEISDCEAFHEYSGYGSSLLDSKVYEAAKKDFYRHNAGSLTREKEQDFRNLFSLKEAEITKVVRGIHERINFQEAPLFLPEIVQFYPEIVIKAVAIAPLPGPGHEDRLVEVEENTQGTEIRYAEGVEMRPFMRFQIAKAMAKFFFKEGQLALVPELGAYGKHIEDIQSNLFAAKLLAPANLIKKELGSVNVAKDIVTQLAEIFWVSKTFMNRRLKDILQGQSEL